MRRLLVTGLASLAMVLAHEGAADACTCPQSGPACQAVWETDAVLAGEVIDIADVHEADSFLSRRVRLRLAEAFRGDGGSTIDVFTGAGGGDCGYPFVVGQTYLVYANRYPQGAARYQTSICTRTRHIREAADDLAYLRGRARQTAGMGTIEGVATYFTPDAKGEMTVQTPFAGARVIARGDSRPYEAVTARDGRYQMSVPAGSYRLTFDVPQGYYASVGWLESRDAVNVRDTRGCGGADITVRDDGRISGRVVDASGTPAPGTTVEALSVRPPGWPSRFPYSSRSYRAKTDADGLYEIARLPPGEYTLGIPAGRPGLDRKPATLIFFPGTPDLSSAEIVTMGTGQRVSLADLPLPATAVDKPER